MAEFLNGEWKAFRIDNGKIHHHAYKVFITHNTPLIIGVQEESAPNASYEWKSIGIATNVGQVGTCFDITWEDRCDSKGDGLKNSHQYRLKIISNDLILQIVTSNNEKHFSFGNWYRGTITSNDAIEKTLVTAAKNGDKDVDDWLKRGGYGV